MVSSLDINIDYSTRDMICGVVFSIINADDYKSGSTLLVLTAHME